jgi:hypothetical protein
MLVGKWRAMLGLWFLCSVCPHADTGVSARASTVTGAKTRARVPQVPGIFLVREVDISADHYTS